MKAVGSSGSRPAPLSIPKNPKAIDTIHAKVVFLSPGNIGHLDPAPYIPDVEFIRSVTNTCRQQHRPEIRIALTDLVVVADSYQGVDKYLLTSLDRNGLKLKNR